MGKNKSRDEQVSSNLPTTFKLNLRRYALKAKTRLLQTKEYETTTINCKKQLFEKITEKVVYRGKFKIQLLPT